jgi:hypothetical protein
MIKKTVALFLAAIFLFGCAANYKPILPRQVDYSSSAEDSDVEMQYKYNVLKAAGNKKYARKADDKNIQIVAAEIYNNTDRTLNLGDDIAVYSGNKELMKELMVMTPEDVKKEVRQISGLYMLWGLFWINLSNCDGSECGFAPLPIGLLIGLVNMGGAKKSNNRFVEDLTRHGLKGKTLEPGETAHVLLPLKIDVGERLDIRIVQ